MQLSITLQLSLASCGLNIITVQCAAANAKRHIYALSNDEFATETRSLHEYGLNADESANEKRHSYGSGANEEAVNEKRQFYNADTDEESE